MDDLILVLDEGTTSTRAMLFTLSGSCVGSAQAPLTQHYPHPGHVEHDAAEIWDKTLHCARTVLENAGPNARAAAIAITNQRETVVAWDRLTGAPLAPALVWQDRRTAGQCADLRASGHEEQVQAQTGLLLDPYFSASKMRWMLDHVPAVREAADAGRLALGTIDSWLVWKLSGGAHITDASNASRTMLMPLAKGESDEKGWDAGLCDLFDVPIAALPAIGDSAGMLAMTRPELFGTPIPICALAGDQQAATIGQACLSPGDSKATYGTGAFVLTHAGVVPPHSTNRLLATVLCQLDGQRSYALEGSVFVAGSLLGWLKDGLGLIREPAEAEALARSVADNGGVTLVPALSGLGAPHWRSDVQASLGGLSFATSRAHIARAALEAMAHQTRDLMACFAEDGAPWARLRIDGGMAANDWIAQDLADMLDLTVERPAFVETTALGAAMLAATGAGHYPTLAEAAKAMRGAVHHFTPAMAATTRTQRLNQWDAALSRLLA